MNASRTVKAASRPRSVGVIFSAQDLRRALRLRKPPDLFELRLDGLISMIDQLPKAIPSLRRPLIITARSPREGGTNNLSLHQRRNLLRRFLPLAELVDIELADAERFSSIQKLARRKNIGVIMSLHALTKMPGAETLQAAAARAHSLGAEIFKIVARTEDREQLRMLLEFARSRLPIAVSAMGTGRFGRISRARLSRADSVLNYAYLARRTVEGQWSLAQLRAAMRRKR